MIMFTQPWHLKWNTTNMNLFSTTLLSETEHQKYDHVHSVLTFENEHKYDHAQCSPIVWTPKVWSCSTQSRHLKLNKGMMGSLQSCCLKHNIKSLIIFTAVLLKPNTKAIFITVLLFKTNHKQYHKHKNHIHCNSDVALTSETEHQKVWSYSRQLNTRSRLPTYCVYLRKYGHIRGNWTPEVGYRRIVCTWESMVIFAATEHQKQATDVLCVPEKVLQETWLPFTTGYPPTATMHDIDNSYNKRLISKSLHFLTQIQCTSIQLTFGNGGLCFEKRGGCCGLV